MADTYFKTLKIKITFFDVFNIFIMTLLAAVTIFPFYYLIAISLGSYEEIIKSSLYIFPTAINLESYKIILNASNILNSFYVSIFITVCGTLLSMLLSVSGAYAVSKKYLPGRKLIYIFIIFTLFFSGGLIPYYLTVKAVHLIDKIYVLMIPMAINSFYLILLKNYFDSIPASLEESAKIDGANDVYILYKIIIPLSAPIIATISLFYAVERWNEWYHAMLFMTTKKYYPLQMVLREVLFDFEQIKAGAIGQEIAASRKFIYSRSVQMAVVVVSTIPILLVYPYLQKHFTRGIMLGSIKE